MIPFAGLLDPGILNAVARRAQRLGVGGDEVLRCHGILPPEQITETIAAHLELAVDPLLRTREPISLAAACAGVLARDDPGWSRSITVAPTGLGLRRLAQALEQDPGLANHLRFTSPQQLNQHVRLVAARALTHEAVHGLHRWRPDLSASGNERSLLFGFATLLGATAVGAAIAAPIAILTAIEYFLAFSFSVWTALRVVACFVRPVPSPRIEIPDRFLPVYTLIVPLHREACVVSRLVTSLQDLDYPPEKLDVKIVLEEDDDETRHAVEALTLRAPFEIVILQHSEPRTKPKALAATLPFARGSYVAVYDAEDEPDPRQLRDALAVFKSDPGLACVQAKLTIDNVDDGWLSRYFAAEYAGLFEVFLPALARARLPLPLGGTSNHFRTDILRRVGGWDPFNVTEDADLGMRLARFGYRTGTVDSLTWEEAPIGYWQWLSQRTRWFKGWLQTWQVHMRHPVRLWRELGWAGFFTFQLVAGGSILAALLHPIFLVITICYYFFAGVCNWLALAVLVSGYAGSICIALVGLKRRRLSRIGWILGATPLYWLLLSAAAARAIYQFVRADHRWEKTPHGLGRSSLRAEQPRRAKAVDSAAREFTAAIAARNRGRG